MLSSVHQASSFGYSPGPSQTVNMVERYPVLSDSDSSSNSPDSLYSSSSPTMPMMDTANLDNLDYDDEVEEHEEEEYETLLDNPNPFAAPNGTYIESEEMSWAPSPKDSPSRRLSVISAHRGSISGGESLLKATLLLQQRRDSTPSIMDDRRRSSTKSLNSTTGRRRSSAVSNNGSFLDPTEEARLRSFAAMDLLSRRFSEVVEVSPDEAYGDTYMARQRLQSHWSRSSASSTEDSELMTASYNPTPDPQSTDGLVSNYPLASVAGPTVNLSSTTLSTAEVLSERPSPAIPPRLVHPVSSIAIGTPPPPVQPSVMWKQRTRPLMQRHATTENYQFPPPLAPAGTKRPAMLNRSISAPFFGSSDKDRPYAQALALRAAGTFTVARPAPLGTTPLRASTRRESIVSILSDVSSIYSRRSSMVVERRQSIGGAADVERRFSTDFGSSDKAAEPIPMRRDSTKSSLFSITGRRKSSAVDLRRESLDRRASLANPLANSRSSLDLPVPLALKARRKSSNKSSQAPRRSSEDLRSTVASSRKSSTDRRTSVQSSRKSSVVSFGEYGYLAQEIHVATALPPVVSTPATEERKRAVPAFTLSLPPRENTSWSMITSTIEEVKTPMSVRPKFNPMDSFLGQTVNTPEERLIDPLDTAVTPRPGIGRKTSVLDRPRPVGHAEYMDHRAMPKRVVSKSAEKQDVPVASPESVDAPTLAHSEALAGTTSPIKSILKTGGVIRKPVPPINLGTEDLRVRAEMFQQTQRRGAMERFEDDSVDPLEVPGPTSILKRSSSLTMAPTVKGVVERPAVKRHRTGFSFHGESGQSSDTGTPESGRTGRPGSHFGRLFKW